MKLLLVLFGLVAVSQAQKETNCYEETKQACVASSKDPIDLTKCNALYGSIGRNNSLAIDLSRFANKQITHSFQYLLLSTHFANYQMNRKGFEKMYRKYSDESWEHGIELIKYMTKRGISMAFTEKFTEDKDVIATGTTFNLYELESLAKSLEIQKSLAEKANKIHHEAVRHHDAEVMSHIENTYVHKLRDNVREMSGHTNDLKTLLSVPEVGLNLYLFDEHLQKLY